MDLLSGYQSSSSSSSDDDDDDNDGIGIIEGKQTISSGNATAAAATMPELVPPPPTPTPTPAAAMPVLRRPPPGAIHAAPRPSVPLAVLRSQGLITTNLHSLVVSTNSSASTSSAIAKYGGSGALHMPPLQGPASLHDPTDKTSSKWSYLQSRGRVSEVCNEAK